jgi:peroxiredoxin
MMRKAIPFSLLLILLTTACSAALASASVASPEKGAQAPEFSLETLEGGSLSIADLRGQVVLVNFWATWCGPCRLEMPALQARFENTDLAVLAVNFDESPEQVQAFVDELGLTFPTLLDPGGDTQLLYQVRGYPTSYLIDEEGTIQIVHIGFMNDDQLDGYLTELGLLN